MVVVRKSIDWTSSLSKYDGLPSRSAQIVPPYDGLPSPSAQMVPPYDGLPSPSAQMVPPYDGLPSPSAQMVPPYDGLPSPSAHEGRRKPTDLEVHRTVIVCRRTWKSIVRVLGPDRLRSQGVGTKLVPKG